MSCFVDTAVPSAARLAALAAAPRWRLCCRQYHTALVWWIICSCGLSA
jgi:hypothetical protein